MPSVVLSMIVKNEEAVIKRCIDSWKDHVDYWVIVDTGSTDKTMEIIKKELKDYPGHLFEHKWVSMGHNRSALMKLSKKHADYHICLDADEILTFNPGWKDQITDHDKYLLDCGNIGTLDRIFKTKCNWTCNMAWHAGYSAKNPDKKTMKIISRQYLKFHHYADGHRSEKTSKEKYTEVVNGLIQDIKDNGNTGRRQFYLGQSYKDAGDNINAILELTKRIQMGGWQEEVYWSYLYIARITHSEDDYLKAIKHTSNRLEAIYELSLICYMKGEHKKAYEYAAQGIKVKIQNYVLFHNVSLYKWKMYDHFMLTAYNHGKYSEGISIGLQLLKTDNIPKDQYLRVVNNLEYCWKKIKIDTDWTIHNIIVKHINTLLPSGTILELGSGQGTQKLTKTHNVYSVEHDKKFLNKVETTNYIHAPLKECLVNGFTHTQWYDLKTLPEKYDLVLVDGPPGNIGRSGLLNHLNMFRKDVPFIFNDAHRDSELKIIKKVSLELNKKYKLYDLPGNRKYGVIV